MALVTAMLTLLLGGMAYVAEPASAAAYRTTSGLNMRSGPGTSFAVVRVIPSGATVDVTGGGQFGFLPVTYSGSSGWASADYLTSGSSSGSGTTTGGATGTRYVFDGRLNLRSGPATSYGVVLVMPDGAAVSLTGETSNGYSKLTYNGTTGWAASQFLGTSGSSGSNSGSNSGSGTAVGDTVTGTAYPTANLNMRSGPGTSYAVRLTIPSGAKVDVMGAAQGGFTPVRYNGTKGWASSSYLGSSGSNSGSNPGSGTVTSNKVTTAAVNMRSGPGTSYNVVRLLPPGTAVGITGGAQNGFLPAKWGSLTGFISSSYLADPGSSSDPGSNTSGDQAIINIIYAAADKWGQPRADMLRVARCESNLNPAAVNRSSGASGLFQFMPGTFAGTPNGKRGESIFNAQSSADAAGWMWANGMRNHWECQ